MEDQDAITIDYTNHRGERRDRRIKPVDIYFGSTAYHPEPGWLLRAMDVEKGALRDFSLADIHKWGPRTCSGVCDCPDCGW
jgi:predicted DNA-binding transcriptional regulator YafY